MTDNIKRYLDLQKQDGTKNKRRNLLEAMTNVEIDFLIAQAGNQTAKIFYAGYKK